MICGTDRQTDDFPLRNSQYMFGNETAEFYFGYETNNLFRGTKQPINFRVRKSNSYETAERFLGTKSIHFTFVLVLKAKGP